MSKLFLHERLMKDEHKSLLLMDSLVALKRRQLHPKQNAAMSSRTEKYFTRQPYILAIISQDHHY